MFYFKSSFLFHLLIHDKAVFTITPVPCFLHGTGNWPEIRARDNDGINSQSVNIFYCIATVNTLSLF